MSNIKTVTLSPTAREKLSIGLNILADAVKVTLGPQGRYVVIKNEFENHAVTKDGVTVAKAIELSDPIEDLGATLLREAAKKAVDTCGDGTTTSIVLAQALVNNANKLITEHKISPVLIKKEYERLTKESISYINSIAKPVTYSSPELLEVATIAANNDPELGKIISDAVSRASNTGIVLSDQSKSTETYLELIEGCKIDRG